MGSIGAANSHPHIAVFAFPFASHPGNLFTFTCMLATAAPTATFSFFSSAASLSSLSSAARPDNVRLYCLDDGAAKDSGDNVVELIEKFVGVAPRNFRAGIKVAEEDAGGAKVSRVVSDAFLWMAGEVAEEMGVPWVALWTCGPGGLLAHLYTDLIRHKIGVLYTVDETNRAKLNKTLDFIPSLSVLSVSDLPTGIATGDIHSDLAVLLHRAGLALPHSAAAVVLNTFAGLNPDIDAELASLFKNHLPIGPFNLLNNAVVNYNNGGYDECLSWLDRHGPATVTYISFGTMMTPGRSDLEELAHGLEAAGVPFLWSLKGEARDGLPPGFLDRTKGRGLTVAWAPQVRVLAHAAVGAFLTHCGWNSVMEGITSAVPMVCRPFFGEQKANARMVAEGWRIGVAIDSEGVAMREKIVNALKMVLREEEGMRMRERLGEIKKQAEKAVGDGGSSRENFRRVLKVICGGHLDD